MPTVLAAWTKLIVDYARDQGLDPAPALAQVGLTPEVLADRDGRIATPIDDALWARLAAELGDEDLGTHLAEGTITADSLGVLGFAARVSPTLGEGVDFIARHHRLLEEDVRIEVVRAPTCATLIVSPTGGPPWPRFIAEAILGRFVTTGRVWSGAPIVPLEVHFQHARPRDLRELDRLFGCKLRFEQRDDAVVLPRDALEAPLVTADPGMLAYLSECAAARLAALGDRGLATDVRAAIAGELASGRPSVQRVARRLALSMRTLQRQLTHEGLAFSELVDQVRHELAIDLLRRRVPFPEVTGRLGFSDERAFRRAFQRWTGHTPSRWAASAG